MAITQIIIIFFLGLSIYLTCDAYRKHPELKKFKTGIIIAVTLGSLAIVTSAISLGLILKG